MFMDISNHKKEIIFTLCFVLGVGLFFIFPWFLSLHSLQIGIVILISIFILIAFYGLYSCLFKL